MKALFSLLKDFDFAAMLPDLDTFVGRVELMVRLLVLAGPVLLLVLGAMYYFKPPKEANYAWGFRTYFGMGSVEVWRFTQKIAGLCWIALGGVLTVIMLIVGLFYGGMNAMEIVTSAVWCVGIELVLVIASWVGINMVVLKFFDKDGNRRQQ